MQNENDFYNEAIESGTYATFLAHRSAGFKRESELMTWVAVMGWIKVLQPAIIGVLSYRQFPIVRSIVKVFAKTLKVTLKVSVGILGPLLMLAGGAAVSGVKALIPKTPTKEEKNKADKEKLETERREISKKLWEAHNRITLTTEAIKSRGNKLSDETRERMENTIRENRKDIKKYRAELESKKYQLIRLRMEDVAAMYHGVIRVATMLDARGFRKEADELDKFLVEAGLLGDLGKWVGDKVKKVTEAPGKIKEAVTGYFNKIKEAGPKLAESLQALGRTPVPEEHKAKLEKFYELLQDFVSWLE